MAITNNRQAKDFVAGAPDIILKGDFRPKKERTMMAGPDYVIKRMEDLLDLGYDYDTAGRLAMDEDLYQEAMDKGPIDDYAEGGRVKYGLGSLVKSIKKAAKKVVKSPIGKAALLYTGVGALGNLAGGRALFSNFLSPTSFIGGASDIFKKGALTNILNLSGADKGASAVMDALKVGGAGGVITGLLSGLEREEGESDQDFMDRTQAVKDQLKVQFKRLNPQGANESNSDYDIRIDAMVANASEGQGSFAIGGRVGYAKGDTASDNAMQAAGIEGLPIRQNPKGVKELDLRETGGFIPPVGVKEKADDIPAMLSNNEFVFTADAVRAAGGGSVNKGAQRMYDLMKNLESKVV